MKWTNLLKDKCPKCGRALKRIDGETRKVVLAGHQDERPREIKEEDTLACATKNCHFSIGDKRMEEIRQNIATRRTRRRYYY